MKLRYVAGVLSLDGYFEVDLEGRVKLYRDWDSIEIGGWKEEAVRFLIDFLSGRRVQKVEYHQHIFDIDPSSYRSYNVVAFYEDCRVCFYFHGGNYVEVLFAHERFIMIFSRSRVLIRFGRRREVIEPSGFSKDYLKMFVLEFSNKMIDINAVCEFRLVSKGLDIDVDGRWLFGVEYDRVVYSKQDFIYYNVESVKNVGDFYDFMWSLYEESIDRFDYEQVGNKYILRAGNFLVKYDKLKGIDFGYRYEDSDVEFEIELSYLRGKALVSGRVRNGAMLWGVFEDGMDMFVKMIESDNRIEKYIKAVRF